MAKKDEFKNDYRLDNITDRINTPEELDRIFEDFSYFSSHCQQIIDKNGVVRPMVLNPAQKVLATKLMKMIAKPTRLNRRHNIVILKGRQMGISTLMVSFINYLMSYVEGLNNLHTYHIFPVGASGGKFYSSKVLPIITGVHPDIYPTMERTFTDSTTREITYHHTKGARRNNRYEIVSANASSLRGGSGQLLILDEVADYTKPYDLEAAVDPVIPESGFSLVMYLSTFSDKRSPYFLEKIKTARANPEDWTLIFLPWYLLYPEVKRGIDVKDLELTEYDKKTIIPALKADGIPKDQWGDCIDWYHRKSLVMPLRIKQEYPTTVDEVIALGSNERVFDAKDIGRMRERALKASGASFTVANNIMTHKPELVPSTNSPLRVYRKPVYGHKYIIVVDPIGSSGDNSDFFAATVMDQGNHEQVATLRGRGIPEEEWAIMTEALAKVYNRAMICPESNVAEGFKATIWNLGYYNWYYPSAAARLSRSPGIRTTVTSKREMIELLQFLIKNDIITIYDPDWINELEIFERKVKRMGDDRAVVTFAAPSHAHDDCVATLWIYAGTLNSSQIRVNTKKKVILLR